jgi:hypothetical protein
LFLDDYLILALSGAHSQIIVKLHLAAIEIMQIVYQVAMRSETWGHHYREGCRAARVNELGNHFERAKCVLTGLYTHRLCVIVQEER